MTVAVLVAVLVAVFLVLDALVLVYVFRRARRRKESLGSGGVVQLPPTGTDDAWSRPVEP